MSVKRKPQVFKYPHTRVTRIIDGDTVAVDIDMGVGIHYVTNVRLVGVLAPERYEPEGPRATALLEQVCPVGTEVTLVSLKREKYGRLLGEIYLADGTYINGLVQAEFDKWPRIPRNEKKANGQEVS